MSALVKLLTSLIILCVFACMSRVQAQTFRASGARLFAQELETSQAVFDFHSGFWVNLHHFLYQEALNRKRSRSVNDGRARDTEAKASSAKALTIAEERAWAAAIDYYEKAVVTRDLLFDEGLVKANRRLGELEKASSLKDSGLEAELVGALEQAAPVYRTRWWDEHDRANRKWVSLVAPLVQKLGPSLTKQLAGAYLNTWPQERMRVEVTTYANWSGAYTVVRPTLITVSSIKAGNQDLAALEILFHEASHALIGPVRRLINQKFEARKKEVPRDLWHVLLFYTTGEIVRRTLLKDGQKNYTPYADANGLYTRSAIWGEYRKVLEREWQPFIDGKTELEPALTRVVQAL